ncbi:DUF2934 domain-containing protein [Halomonas sp. PR-M31]|uniref:DUF2934 domain-containing protein n=1 Tax=Halomonas sp. PR-M31 TaxID=1471202 RepID=UPI0020A19CF4|nr:DUF2934 domain-containing protein [Halomonas sp. PR-M31]
MKMTDDELRVRQLAYRIWESEGRPDGQQQRHWEMALKIVAAEQSSGHETNLDEEGEAKEEEPVLDDELPLENDERGIEENRLPLENPEADSMLDPDGDATLEEAPYRDDTLITQDTPVQDRAEPTEEPLEKSVEVNDPSAESEVEFKRVPRQRSTSKSAASKQAADKEPAKKAAKPAAKKTTSSKTASIKKTTTRSRKT